MICESFKLKLCYINEEVERREKKKGGGRTHTEKLRFSEALNLPGEEVAGSGDN